MNAYFGEPWGPINEGQAQVPTPVGETCPSCETPIEDGDRGLMMGHLSATADGEPVGVMRPHHAECLMLNTTGHIYGVCSCTRPGPRTPHQLRADALEVWRRAHA